MSEIRVEFEPTSLSNVQKKLDELGTDAPKALRSAINDTAKNARSALAKKAQETYTVKTVSFNKAMTIQNATVSKLEATIKAKGAALQMSGFKVSPATPRNGSKRPSVVKGKNLQKGNMKELRFNGRKAFVISVGKGHNAVVARKVDYESQKDRKRHKRNTYTFYAPSVPAMIGNEQRVYGVVRPTIENNLEKNVENEVRKYMRQM